MINLWNFCFTLLKTLVKRFSGVCVQLSGDPSKGERTAPSQFIALVEFMSWFPSAPRVYRAGSHQLCFRVMENYEDFIRSRYNSLKDEDDDEDEVLTPASVIVFRGARALPPLVWVSSSSSSSHYICRYVNECVLISLMSSSEARWDDWEKQQWVWWRGGERKSLTAAWVCLSRA